MRSLCPVLAGSLVLALGCRDAPDPWVSDEPATAESSRDDAVVLRFGVVTRAEPRLTVQGSQPLIDYLTEATPYRVELRMGQSSEDVELEPAMQDMVTFLEERLVEIAPLGVLSFCLADDRFGAVPLVQSVGDDGEPRARAAFITASSSELRTLDDVRGKTLALGPSHSMLSHVLARHELANAGVDAETSNLASDTAVLDAVRTGAFDAGVVAEELVDDSLRVLHLSTYIPSRPLVVRADLPERVQASLRAALLEVKPGMASDPIFRNGFVTATEVDYRPVRRILNEQSARCTGACHEPVRFGDEP